MQGYYSIKKKRLQNGCTKKNQSLDPNGDHGGHGAHCGHFYAFQPYFELPFFSSGKREYAIHKIAFEPSRIPLCQSENKSSLLRGMGDVGYCDQHFSK